MTDFENENIKKPACYRRQLNQSPTAEQPVARPVFRISSIFVIIMIAVAMLSLCLK